MHEPRNFHNEKYVDLRAERRFEYRDLVAGEGVFGEEEEEEEEKEEEDETYVEGPPTLKVFDEKTGKMVDVVFSGPVFVPSLLEELFGFVQERMDANDAAGAGSLKGKKKEKK